MSLCWGRRGEKTQSGFWTMKNVWAMDWRTVWMNCWLGDSGISVWGFMKWAYS